MILSLHKSYTQNAVAEFGVDKNIGNEIIIGSLANDLCEFTNEGHNFIKTKDAVFDIFGMKEKIFGSIAIYQSHFGNLASMHAMAKADNEHPEITRQEIAAWFDFLNGVALGAIPVKPDKRIGEDNTPISDMFSSHSIEYGQIFDSEDAFGVKNRAIGMMCHLIEDLFTESHCLRDGHNEIRMFYFYSAQDKQKHKESDHAAGGLEQELQKQCNACIQSLQNNTAYDYGSILVLSGNAKESGGGAFA